MSVSRGFFLKSFHSKSNEPSHNNRRVSSIFLILFLLGAVALTAKFHWSGIAAIGNRTGHSNAETIKSLEPLPKLKTRGPVISNSYDNSFANSFGGNSSAAPGILQACTLDCTATVPTAGQINTPVSFQSTASPSGCASQAIYDWNFGDGTARSNQQNPSHSYATAGTYNWTLTTSVNTGSTTIDTVVGGVGDGNQAKQAPFGTPVAIARDPAGRGIYVSDTIGGANLVRFINLSGQTITLAGQIIPAGAVRAIAGGGTSLNDDVTGLQADLGIISGLGTSGNGDLVYVANTADAQVRVINVSPNTVTNGSFSVGAGRVKTLSADFGPELSGLAVNQTTGDIYVADASQGINKVYKITAAGVKTIFAGNGMSTTPGSSFVAGQATAIPLLEPRAVEIESSGQVIISDTRHGRAIRVATDGSASLVYQFPNVTQNSNPYPSSVAIQNGNIYSANGNQLTVTRLSAGNATVVAGVAGSFCDYTTSNCGDGGAGTSAKFNFLGSTYDPPIVGLEGDTNGLFILDQGVFGKGRVRYLNLTGGAVTIGGVTIPAGAIDTIAGSGLTSPYDGGPATGAALSTPVGVAADANGNLWVTDPVNAYLRFVNRGATPVTIFPNTTSAQTVAPGAIVTVNKDAGIGQSDGGPALQAGFDTPQGLFVTNQGVYIADSKSGPSVPLGQIGGRRTSLIRFINTTANNVTLFPGSSSPIVVQPGQVIKIAGGADPGGNGDGSFALDAKFIGASDLVVTANGTIYVADVGQNAVRKIDGNNGRVSSLGLGQAKYTGLGLDSAERLYIANYDGSTVLRETNPSSGAFTTIANNLTRPRDVAVGADGTAYVTVGPPNSSAGSSNHQVVQLTPSGASYVSAVIAGASAGFGGDGGSAANALINISPLDLNIGSGITLPETVNIIVGPSGDVFFTDTNNNRVRRLSPSMVMCVKTGTITIAGNNPVPVLASLDPNNALQNSGSFTLTVNGSNFVPAATVKWNGQDRSTLYNSATQLTATIPASDLLNAGTASVTVFNPTPGGGTSNALNFTITAPNPVPAITGITPSSILEGSAAFILTVNGSGFVNGSKVRWDGQERVTVFANSGQLTAQITAADVSVAGTATVTVISPAPGGGTSNSITFTITSNANPSPTLTSISPAAANVNGPAFNLTAKGTNFAATTKLRWNGQDRQTAIVSSTELNAVIPASDLTTAGTAKITVFTPTPGGGVSSQLDFAVVNITSVSAASFQGNPIAAESIIAAFGVSMATGIQEGLTIPLPTTLLGTTVKVKDSAGTERDAGLFFVAPGQINYQLPPGTVDGNATVTVITNGVVVGTGPLVVARVAPGLISANSNGIGVAAADVLRDVNGVQTYEKAFTYDQASSQYIPLAIDLGPANNNVFLILYGTGFRFNSGLGNVKVKIGGFDVAVGYANVVPGLIGLDQCNVGPIPRNLIGAGVVDVETIIDGKTLNKVQVRFK